MYTLTLYMQQRAQHGECTAMNHCMHHYSKFLDISRYLVWLFKFKCVVGACHKRLRFSEMYLIFFSLSANKTSAVYEVMKRR